MEEGGCSTGGERTSPCASDACEQPCAHKQVGAAQLGGAAGGTEPIGGPRGDGVLGTLLVGEESGHGALEECRSAAVCGRSYLGLAAAAAR